MCTTICKPAFHVGVRCAKYSFVITTPSNVHSVMEASSFAVSQCRPSQTLATGTASNLQALPVLGYAWPSILSLRRHIDWFCKRVISKTYGCIRVQLSLSASVSRHAYIPASLNEWEEVNGNESWELNGSRTCMTYLAFQIWFIRNSLFKDSHTEQFVCVVP